jgi:NADP-dependent 3-hydroxy acid dehydrogenase YdfG
MILENKTAIIYGATGAIGTAVAQAMAREGATLLLAARNEQRLQEQAARLRAGGAMVYTGVVDATDAGSVTRHGDDLVSRHGRVDIMFNAIGWEDEQGIPLSQIELRTFLTPVTKALTTWHATGGYWARHMAAQGRGVILGFTATAGHYPISHVGGFGVACAAVEAYLHQLGQEMGPEGVRVAAVRSAGSPDTPGLKEVFTNAARSANVSFEEIVRRNAAGAALRRMPSVAEAADAVVLLASDYARAMTVTSANVTCGAAVD